MKYNIKKILSVIWKIISLIGNSLVIFLLVLNQKEKINDKTKKRFNNIKNKINYIDKEIKDVEEEHYNILKNKKERDKQAKKFFITSDTNKE